MIGFHGKIIKIMQEVESDLPKSLIAKLYDRTGTKDGGNKGFVLFYIDSYGEPFCIVKTENTATRMSLQKAIEVMLQEQETNFELFE